MMRHLLCWFVALLMAPCALWAQPRPMAATTITTTDTSANSLLIGCAIGSAVCTGGIKAGNISVAGGDFSGPVTLTNSGSGLLVTNAVPVIEFNETDAPANEKIWQFAATGGDYQMIAVNDARSASTFPFTVTRTGTTIDTFAIGATTTTTLGLTATTMTGSSLLLTSTSPLLKFQDTNSTADERRWRISTDVDTFTLQATNDAESVTNDVFQVNRTGAVVDELVMAVPFRLPALAFASLPVGAANGTMIYCTNCTVAQPCAGGGGGAVAKRIAGTWGCL